MNKVIMFFRDFSKVMPFLILAAIANVACSSDDRKGDTSGTPDSSFSNPTSVSISGLPIGYNGTPVSTEEPFISRDGLFLFFNSGAQEGSKDLYVARWTNDQWVCVGELGPSVNTSNNVQGVGTLDISNNFYFIDSGTEYMVKKGLFLRDQDQVTNIEDATNFPKRVIDIVSNRLYGNIGVELAADGSVIYFSRAAWEWTNSTIGKMLGSDILYLKKNGNTYLYDAVSVSNIMQNINTEDLEYAACISSNGLEFFFTRFRLEDYLSNRIHSMIMRCTRQNTNEPFSVPVMVEAIGSNDFVEAPAISADGHELYYHRLSGDKFRLYKVTR